MCALGARVVALGRVVDVHQAVVSQLVEVVAGYVGALTVEEFATERARVQKAPPADWAS